MPPRRTGKRKLQSERGVAADRVGVKKGKQATSAVPTGKALSDVFKEMAQEDAQLTVIEARLHGSRSQSAANSRERTALLEKLKNLDAAERALAGEIQSDTRLTAAAQAKLKDLRFWGSAVRLADLPNELLELIFMCSGYPSQQRLIRVCRRWKRVITCEVSHLYMDWRTLFEADRDSGGNPRAFPAMKTLFLHPPKTGQPPDWKYRNAAVRQITFNGLQAVRVWAVEPYMSAWADWYPNLTGLHLTQIFLGSAVERPLAAWLARRPNVRVLISQAILPAMPNAIRLSKDAQTLLGRGYDSFVRVPDLVVTTGEAYERCLEQALWPYPDAQTAWLTTHTHTIDAQLLGSVFHRVKQAGFSSAGNEWCRQHNKLCKHLDGAYYRANMDGRVKNMLAVWVLDRKKIAPPFPLQFERFQLVNGQQRLVTDFLQ